MKRLLASLLLLPSLLFAESARPNVLFISMDDLNDWIGCMGGHPQTITPNLDRLAESGVLFTNAHCPAPACNPSRSSIFTGLPPHRTGLYQNNQKLRELMPEVELMPAYFSRQGYHAHGSGKMLHYFIDARSWDDYFPEAKTENPFPDTYYPKTRPVSLPRGGPWQYVETDWAALPVDDATYGGDHAVAEWVSARLGEEQDKPFFLACGIYRPHEPWFVPEAYFEPFPLDSIQLPPGYREDDLNDLPPSGQRMGPNRYFAHIREHGQWKQGIQGYLASIHFADAMLGKVLDALEAGPHADNTIVVLWSDHGWHLGEKQHWQKFTGWRLCTRVPLMMRVPKGTVGLPQGTPAGARCDQPVSLVDLFHSLTELCGLPAKGGIQQRSLVPLLTDPGAEWTHLAVTQINGPDSYAISGRDWRLIHYKEGEEELYDLEADPFEWTNLLHGRPSPEALAQLDRLTAHAPENPLPLKAPSVASLGRLKWHPAEKAAAPPSRPEGSTFPVHFINRREETVEVFWMRPNGGDKSYGLIEPGKTRALSTRPGAVWDLRKIDGTRLGHIRVGDRSARVLVPK